MKNSLISISIIFLLFANSSLFASDIDSFNKSEIYSNLHKGSRMFRKDKETLIKQIELDIQNEKNTEAMLELNKLLNTDTSDARIYLLSAKLLRNTYQFDEAVKMARKALDLNYKDSNAYLELGYIYLDKARFAVNTNNKQQSIYDQSEFMQECFDHFFMASQYAPDSPFPHIGLAEAYFTNRQKSRSKDESLKAKELSFGNPQAYYALGEYYYKIRDFDKAKKYIEKSIETGSNSNYKAYFYAAKVSEKEGDIKKAQQLYLKTLKLKPEMLEAQKHLDKLIKTSYKERKSEENEPINFMEVVDEDLQRLLKAEYYLILDEFTKARDIYIELLKNNPDNANAAAGLAELYYSKWREGYSTYKNFASDSLYIIKTNNNKKNVISFLKFDMINESKIPEKVRQELINLSISKSYDFYDLLNEVRAEYLLGNFEEAHNKLYNFMSMKLSNYEKFKILKYLCYDHNYYEANIVLEDLKKTYYHNEEIDPIEKRITAKLQIAGEKVNKALNIIEKAEDLKKQFRPAEKAKAIAIYQETIKYFPAYKPAYLHYALAVEEQGNYHEAYDKLNIYYKLYKIYPDRNPEISEGELKSLIKGLYSKIQQQMQLQKQQ